MENKKINLQPVTPGFEDEIAEQHSAEHAQHIPSTMDQKPQPPTNPTPPKPAFAIPDLEPADTTPTAPSIIAILLISAIGIYNIVLGGIAFFAMFDATAGESTQVIRNILGFFGFCSILFGIGLVMRKGIARKILIGLQAVGVLNDLSSLSRLADGAHIVGTLLSLVLSVAIIIFLSSRTVKDIFTS